MLGTCYSYWIDCKIWKEKNFSQHLSRTMAYLFYNWKKIIRTDDRGPDKTEKMQKKVDE